MSAGVAKRGSGPAGRRNCSIIRRNCERGSYRAVCCPSATGALPGRATFLIAHRLSTVRSANQILYLDGGRIVEGGTHAELLRVNGHYRRLYPEQFLIDEGAAASYGAAERDAAGVAPAGR